MNIRRRPNARVVQEIQAQPQRQPLSFDALKRPLPFFTASMLVLCFSCTLARLVLVGLLFNRWRAGLPALCYGAVAHLDYSTLDTTTAFVFSSISNAIASVAYNETIKQACHVGDYSLVKPDSQLNTICIYLMIVSVWDLVALIVVQGICWYRLFKQGCRATTLLWSSLCGLMSLGFEMGSIYLGSREVDSTISGLSVIIFICALVFLGLNTSVFIIQRRRGNDLRDNMKVATPGFREAYAIIFRQAVRHSSPNTREHKPNMAKVQMYNPTLG